jgi:excisionase family DNA binding protein
LVYFLFALRSDFYCFPPATDRAKISRVNELLMTKRRCGELLGVSLRTVDRMISEKKLPAVKVRRSIRIPIDAVLKLVSTAQ